jgi:hypothetical protein
LRKEKKLRKKISTTKNFVRDQVNSPTKLTVLLTELNDFLWVFKKNCTSVSVEFYARDSAMDLKINLLVRKGFLLVKQEHLPASLYTVP